MSTGEELKAMRERAGLTQSELAKRCGFTTAQFVSNWERDIALPSFACVRRFATAVSVDPARVLQLMHSQEIDNVTAKYNKMIRKLESKKRLER